MEDWVKRFFDGSLNYGAKLRQTKLKASDLDDEMLEFAAKQLKITPGKLQQEILSQKIHTVFWYRAEWREDLIQLVYMPKMHKFIAYARGY